MRSQPEARLVSGEPKLIWTAPATMYSNRYMEGAGGNGMTLKREGVRTGERRR